MGVYTSFTHWKCKTKTFLNFRNAYMMKCTVLKNDELSQKKEENEEM